jgi:hypothetical protein
MRIKSYNYFVEIHNSSIFILSDVNIGEYNDDRKLQLIELALFVANRQMIAKFFSKILIKKQKKKTCRYSATLQLRADLKNQKHINNLKKIPGQ